MNTYVKLICPTCKNEVTVLEGCQAWCPHPKNLRHLPIAEMLEASRASSKFELALP